MTNAKVRKLEDKIIFALNDEPEVPMEVKRLILRDVLRMVEDQANAEILVETKEAENAEST